MKRLRALSKEEKKKLQEMQLGIDSFEEIVVGLEELSKEDQKILINTVGSENIYKICASGENQKIVLDALLKESLRIYSYYSALENLIIILKLNHLEKQKSGAEDHEHEINQGTATES